MGIVSYEGFSSNYSRVSSTISDLNDTLVSTTKLLQSTLNDSSKGNWAASKLNDWDPIARSITAKLERMQALMDAAAQGNADYAAWEQQHSGIN